MGKGYDEPCFIFGACGRLRRRFVGRKHAVVADAFWCESGFTTIGAAIAILLSCSLLFFGLWTARSASRSAGVQAVADACALAAENEVAEFVLAVRVADATLLSMSLTGISLVGIGLVCCCVPGAEGVGAKCLDAARTVVQKRESVARAQERSLGALQAALPVAAQTQAQLVASENSETIGFSSLAYVELVPFDAPDVSCGVSSAAADAVEAALDQSDSVVSGAQQAEQAAREAASALHEGWLADCGAYPQACMRERAEALAGMADAENPMARSENSWSYAMALKRAQNYYRHRIAQEAPASDDVQEQARSALRKRFYEYAGEKVDRGHVVELPDGTVDIDLPLLPRNTEEMKATGLYTEASYVASAGSLHAWDGCPAVGAVEGFGSLSQIDAGEFHVCAECGLDAAAMGSVAAASTSIDNGFEHHFRKVAESAADYQQAKNEAVGQASGVKSAISDLLDLLDAAISEAAGNRVEAYPPGRFGALAAIAGDLGSEGGNAFFSGPDLGPYAAVSAALMVDDKNDDALTNLLEGLAGGPDCPIAEGGDMALALWSALLSAYGTGVEGVRAGVASVLDGIPLASASGLGTWASDALLSMLESAGLEPANTASAKAVTSNAAPIAQRGEGPVAEAVRNLKET